MTVRLQHPLEHPSRLDSAVDLRRVRAFTVASLEEAVLNGHTLLPKDKAVDAIVSRPVRPPCPVTGDMLSARAPDLAPEIISAPMDGDLALQLSRYKAIGELVRKQVNGRIGGQRHVVGADWTTLLQEKFGPATDDEEKRARTEKAGALKELAESRFSVLAGPAGAGKTTMDQRGHLNRKLRFQGFCRSIRLIEWVFWSFYSTVRSDLQY